MLTFPLLSFTKFPSGRLMIWSFVHLNGTPTCSMSMLKRAVGRVGAVGKAKAVSLVRHALTIIQNGMMNNEE